MHTHPRFRVLKDRPPSRMGRQTSTRPWRMIITFVASSLESAKQTRGAWYRTLVRSSNCADAGAAVAESGNLLRAGSDSNDQAKLRAGMNLSSKTCLNLWGCLPEERELRKILGDTRKSDAYFSLSSQKKQIHNINS